MAEAPQRADADRLYCLRMASEYRNMAVEALPPEVKAHLEGVADFWETKATSPDGPGPG